jgi:hypothetical protein
MTWIPRVPQDSAARYIAAWTANRIWDTELGSRDMAERRDFLRKTAVVGMDAFTVPMVVTVDPRTPRRSPACPLSRPGPPRKRNHRGSTW